MRTYQTECRYCGDTFTASRNTAQYCKPAHRIAAYRKREKLDWYRATSFDILTELERATEDRKTAWQAAQAVRAIRTMCEYILPPTTRWWRCDTCKSAVKRFVPDGDECPCGQDAQWYIQA